MSRAPLPRFCLAGCILLAACSNGTEPGDELPLLVLPAVDTISADSSAQFRVVQVSADGDTLEVPGAVWTSRNPDLATASATGLVEGLRSGNVTIVALAGDLRGTAEVRVERRFRARDVSTGAAGICAVDLDGGIWCRNGWGSGNAYPAPDPSDVRTFREPVRGSTRYTTVGSNRFFACGLSTSGEALCWGYSPLGDSLSAGVPTPIASGLTFDTLSIQGWLGCGLAAQQAHCWGVPIRAVKAIDTEAPLVSLDVQEFDGCGWTADAVQLCWDDSGFPATPHGRVEPPPGADVPSLHGLVSGGDFFCGLDPDGSAWCWGANQSGQLGNGTVTSSVDPVRVAGDRHFTRLSASNDGSSHLACAIDDGDELFCWGLGFGPVPTPVLY
jgi:Bacterial Ig-like domain (group 2)/Regulator of chromosome condensation (RCC1) repeat